ncbi:MAG TPA: histidine phosphatase family protein [Candidatus Limnocylindrales bacterium]
MSGDRSSHLQLHLLRHADAGDPEAWDGDDADRPLSSKGEAQAERLATFLHGVRFGTDALICSPKVRARRTAEIVADGIGAQVRVDDRLAGGFAAATVDQILADAGSPGRAVLVGHDPDFSELLATLAGAREMTMKKGAFARVDVRGPVADGRGTLRWLIPPDLLDRDRR